MLNSKRAALRDFLHKLRHVKFINKPIPHSDLVSAIDNLRGGSKLPIGDIARASKPFDSAFAFLHQKPRFQTKDSNNYRSAAENVMLSHAACTYTWSVLSPRRVASSSRSARRAASHRPLPYSLLKAD
jgi:hypothetical protein